MLPSAYLVLALALIWVVVSDLLYRRIANRLVLLLLAIWVVHPVLAVAGYGPWAQEPAWLTERLAWPVVGFTLVLLFGYGLFIINRVGAGDVKLLAVLMLWAGPQGVMLLMATSLFGGVLALAMPLLGMVELALAHGVTRFASQWSRAWPVPLILGPDRPSGIPYGLAIAAGAIFTFGIRMP